MEACHRLPSEQNDKTIIRFSRRKDAEMVLSKKQTKKQKNKSKGFNHCSVGIAATISSYGVNAKLYDQRY